MSIVLLKLINIISILVGIILVICALLKPSRLIFNNLNKNDLKDGEKLFFLRRVVLVINGLLFIINPCLFFLNLIDKSDSALLFAITAVLTQLNNLHISKKRNNKL